MIYCCLATAAPILAASRRRGKAPNLVRCQVNRKYVFPIFLLLVAAGSLAFRLPRLDVRPMHADEGTQAELFRRLWIEGRYRYNPDEFHGPTLNYSTLPVIWLGGYASFSQTGEATYRLVPVLFSLGLLLLLWPLADALGKPATICAAVLTAVSPAMVFYSRYYIHETLLVFFTLAGVATLWRYVRSGRLAWCLAAGACAGLMQATKETSVLAFAAMAGGLVLTAAWRWIVRDAETDDRPRIPWWHLAAGAAVAVLVAAIFLSSFLTNPRGLVDGVLTYAPWIGRAAGHSPHVQPWYYFLHLLGWWQRGDGPRWSEGLILILAAAGWVIGWLPARWNRLPDASVWFVRWAGCYTVLLTAAYTAIPYKTPWCLLGFLQGMILLAGVGAVGLVRLIPTLPAKIVLSLVLLAGTSQLAWQAYRASFEMPAELENPYVYVQSRSGILQLSADLEELARAATDGHAVPVKVIWDNDYLAPLPWYLRRFENVACFNHLPDNAAAPIVISAPGTTRLSPGYWTTRT